MHKGAFSIRREAILIAETFLHAFDLNTISCELHEKPITK